MLTCSRDASDPGKQKLSSVSVGSALTPASSESPVGHVMGLPLLSRPNWLAGIGTGPWHSWAWPISSVNEMLSWSAPHGRIVCSDDVLYIGWNAYGMALQLVPVASY